MDKDKLFKRQMDCNNLKKIDTSGLTKLIDSNIDKILSISNYELISKEYPVYGTLNGDYTRRGVIDYVARNKSRYCIIEVEVATAHNEVWNGFKVIAYKTAFCIDRELNLKDVDCLLILNDANYHPNIRNILTVADIQFIFINKNGFPTKTSFKPKEM